MPMCGAQCVMTCGELLMHKWLADNLDFHRQVVMSFCIHCDGPYIVSLF